jgi:hypothetical protein
MIGVNVLGESKGHHRWIERNIIVASRGIRNMILTFGLLAIILGAFFFVLPVQSQPSQAMQTGVNYEGPYDWYYGLSDAEIEQDFHLFKENGVGNIIISIIWSAFQTGVDPATYNSGRIANVKRVLAKAEQYDIGVCVGFFQYWMDTTSGVPSWCIDPWTGNRRTIAIVRNSTIKGYFLEFVGDLVDEFKGSSAIRCWSLLNEPMHYGSYNSSQLSAEREEFHLLIEEGCGVIRARDSRPITVKFTLPYSPWHTSTKGEYATFVDFDRVMQSLDFISINTFANPADFNTTRKWQGTTWDDFVRAVQDTKSAGYTFWVSEFGSNKVEEDQRVHYELAVHIFQELGVDACFSWVWVHNDGAEGYNLCYDGGLPKPAFYELNLNVNSLSISEVAVSNIMTSNVTINWITSEASDSMVGYGLTPSLGTTELDSTLVTTHSVVLTDLSENTVYYFEVRSSDASGDLAIDNNGGEFYTFSTISSDLIPPEIANSQGNINATTGGTVAIMATVTDNLEVAKVTVHYMLIDGTEATAPMIMTESSDVWCANLSVAEDKTGTIMYYLTAEDSVGNVAIDPKTKMYSITVVDDDAPTSEAGPNQTVEVGEMAFFDGSNSIDNIGITTFAWDFDAGDGVQEDAIGFAASHVYSVEGVYIVTLAVTDEAGNRDLDTLQVNVTTSPLDLIPPTIVTATGNVVKTTGEQVTISATITDDIGVAEAVVHYNPIDGTETTILMIKAESSDVWSANLSVPVDKVGTITYFITAEDGGENMARDPALENYAIAVIDSYAPVAEAGLDQTVKTGETVNYDGSDSTDNIGIAIAAWDFDVANGIQKDAIGLSASCVYNVEGTYIVTLSIEDDAGNADTDTLTVTVTDAILPVISDATGNVSGTTGEPVAVFATITDNVGVSEANVYYTPVEGVATIVPMTKSEFSDVWSAVIPVASDKVGVITYYLVAQDFVGNTADNPAVGAYAIVVVDNDAPAALAVAEPDQMVQAGEIVYLDGSGSTDNIGVAMASWDFDSSDGVQQDAIGLTASHVYGVEGTYFVTLNVTDEAGNSAVDTLEVNVTEVPTQPTATFQVVMSEEEIVRKQASSIRVSATVTVLLDGVPLSDATVSGDWSGDLHQTMIGATSSDGKVVFVTRWVKNADTLTLTLTSVQKNGVNYVLAGETSFGT